MTLSVRKRNGNLEVFDAEKINKVIEWACENIKNVSVSEIAVNAELSVFEEMKTTDIHNTLINSAVNLISPKTPEYSMVASRLLSYKLRKDVWGGKNPPKLYDFIQEMVNKGLYDPQIVEWYSQAEINKFDEKIDHDRDFLFEYAGICQLCDKYLVQDRINNKIFETPQQAYMLVAMVLFRNYSKEERIKYVIKAYNYFSKHKINLATPIMAGVRTPVRSGASCCLIETADTLSSLGSVSMVSMMATASKYGIGVDMSNIRSIHTPIRNGETEHTGVIPFLKVLEASIKSCKQGGARRGAGTVTFPIFHPEIMDIVLCKSNTTVEEKRVNHLDYSISISKLFWKRYLEDGNITLFSYHEAQEVYELFGMPEFDAVYEKYERKTSLKYKKVVKARELINHIIKYRIETGRIYLLNIDNANEYSPWSNGRITMSNLCQEVLHVLKPIQSPTDEEGRIGICVLSAINMLAINSEAEHEKVCDVVVRMLDALIDYQDYFAPAAEKFIKESRSIGIGVFNYAAWLAKQGLTYSSEEAPNVTSEYMERQQYYLLKASVNLAKEYGPCELSNSNKYVQGLLQNVHYKKELDEFITAVPKMDWDSLAQELQTFGIRNMTVSCQMPLEATAKIVGGTSGVEPPRSPVTYIKSKGRTLPFLIPDIKHAHKYTYAFEMGDNDGYIKCIAAFQRWMCMSISSNLYYRYSSFAEDKLPLEVVIADHLKAHRYGFKTHYYLNTDDGDIQFTEEQGCSGGACTL